MPYIVTKKRPDGDDRACDCLIPALEGAGQHSPGCECFKPHIVSRRAVATLEDRRNADGITTTHIETSPAEVLAAEDALNAYYREHYGPGMTQEQAEQGERLCEQLRALYDKHGVPADERIAGI